MCYVDSLSLNQAHGQQHEIRFRRKIQIDEMMICVRQHTHARLLLMEMKSAAKAKKSLLCKIDPELYHNQVSLCLCCYLLVHG